MKRGYRNGVFVVAYRKDNDKLLYLLLKRHKIGETIEGNLIDDSLNGYELKITGSSDKAGFPGFEEQTGTTLRRALFRKGDKGLRDRRKGIRLRKTVRGNEISEDTVQININVLKEGSSKFETLLPKKEPAEGEEKPADTQNGTGEGKEAPKETPAAPEEKKEEPAATAPKAKPDEEPKSNPEPEKAEPEEEPKESDKAKEEKANPDEEPTS